MSLLKSILYGFISGLTEFLPVSARGHQALFQYLFGVETRGSLQNLLVHIGILVSVLVYSRETIYRLQKEQKNTLRSRRRRKKSLDSKSLYDLRLLKTASVPMLIGLLLLFSTYRLENNLLFIVVFFILNAVVLLLADHSSHGNRDSRTMSGLDGIVMGVLGSLSVFPGISRTGVIASYATMRGAELQNSISWAVLLSIPALIFTVCYDVFMIFSMSFAGISGGDILGSVFSAITAFLGCYVGISFLQNIVGRSGFSTFAYYSLGTALFSFILYLIT